MNRTFLLITLFLMAGFGERYRCEFWDDAMPPELGYVNTLFTVRFRFPNYAGGVVNLRPMSEPVQISIEGSQEDLFVPLYPAKATFRFASEDFWDAQNLLAIEDQQIQVVIEANVGGNTLNRIIWAGWVQPTEIKEKYASKPYPVEINAACGLSLLKDRLLLNSAGKRLTGQPAVMDGIKAALALTNLGLPITTACNLFEIIDLSPGQMVNGKANPSKDPLSQVRFQSDALVDKSVVATAETVLTDLLNTFGCRLAQVDGDWMIVRAVEAIGGWDVWSGGKTSVMTRRYNPDLIAGSATAKDLTVRVGRTRNVVASGDAEVWGLPIQPAVAIRQEFGGIINRLPNGDFSQSSNGFPVGWTNRTANGDSPTTLGDGSQDDPFRLRIYGAGTNDVNDEFRAVSIVCKLPPNTNTKKLKLALKGRFRLQNTRAAMIWVVGIPNDRGGQWVLNKDMSWMHNPKKRDLLMISINNVYEDNTGKQRTKSGWEDISLEMEPVSNMTELNISLSVAEALDGQTNSPRPFIEYADMRLEAVDEFQKLDGITQMKRLNDKKKKPEPSVVLKFGDVPNSAAANERLGSLFIGADVTQTWDRPDTPAVKGTAKPLVQWSLEERADQRMAPARVWDGSLIGKLPNGIHSVLCFDDLLYPANAQGVQDPIPFMLTKWNWSLRSQRHVVTAVEKLTKATTKPTEKAWDTPDGQIPIEEDATGKPISPSFKSGLVNDALKNLQPGLGFTLHGTALPAKMVPLDKDDNRYTLIAEIAAGPKILGRVLGIARLKNIIPGL